MKIESFKLNRKAIQKQLLENPKVQRKITAYANSMAEKIQEEIDRDPKGWGDVKVYENSRRGGRAGASVVYRPTEDIIRNHTVEKIAEGMKDV